MYCKYLYPIPVLVTDVSPFLQVHGTATGRAVFALSKQTFALEPTYSLQHARTSAYNVSQVQNTRHRCRVYQLTGLKYWRSGYILCFLPPSSLSRSAIFPPRYFRGKNTFIRCRSPCHWLSLHNTARSAISYLFGIELELRPLWLRKYAHGLEVTHARSRNTL